MRHAAQRLIHSSDQVKAIAHSVGYDSPSRFAEHFAAVFHPNAIQAAAGLPRYTLCSL
jgi:transcriptional regulator GlxA family with amidase domain